MPSVTFTLAVTAPIAALGAVPGDQIVIRSEGPRNVVLERHLPGARVTAALAVADGSAEIIRTDYGELDGATFADLKPAGSARPPLRLIRGGVQ